MSQQPHRAVGSYLARATQRIAGEAARVLSRRQLAVRTAVPLVSFTFDDFPRSAFLNASGILGRYGILGTYYVSLSLAGKQSQMGPMYQTEDLKELARLGHELGCHTFGHCHSWNTPPDMYEKAIFDNQQALKEVLPGTAFQTDLNLLCAFFLEQSRENPEAVKRLIDQNGQARGWLILATHDVRDTPSRFGCTPAFFEQVVQWSLESGARIVPVVKALQVLKAPQPKQEGTLR